MYYNTKAENMFDLNVNTKSQLEYYTEKVHSNENVEFYVRELANRERSSEPSKWEVWLVSADSTGYLP